MMVRRFWLAVAVCALAGVVAAGEPVRIGGMAALQVGFGQSIEAGARLAVHLLNEEGGILGNKVELSWLDSEHSPSTGRTVAQRLIFNDQIIALMGCHSSSVVLAVEPMTRQNRVLHLGLGSAPSLDENSEKNPWLNRMRENDLLTVEVVANYAIDTLGLDKFACIYQSDQFGIGGRDSFQDVLKARGVELVANEAMNLNDKDFTSQLLQVKQSGANAMLLFCGVPAIGMITKQARQLMPEVTIFTTSVGASKPFYDVALESSEGVYAVCTYIPDNPNPVVQKFNRDFEAFHNIPPQDFFAALGYDGIMTIAQAMKDAGTTTDREKIRDAYRQIKEYPGATGLTYNGSPDGNMIHELLMVVYRKDGVQEVVATVKGSGK
ncbi:MAG: ABC transporter substrate-binding protein [Planctomycetes bacterium]|nr:ABC transporter substrate-binding protein [Planctomycetota bacterium]